MHIYSIEVEDSQTCHDFWKKTNALWSTWTMGGLGLL
jgi:hypothetical protein